MHRLARFFLLASLVPAFERAAAQAPGDRIRVATKVTSSPSLVGTLVAQDADSFRLRVPGHAGTVAISRADITRLEVSRGETRATATGAGIGSSLGIVVGMLLGRAAAQRSLSRPCAAGGPCNLGDAIAGTTQVFEGGLYGFVLGGLVGGALGYGVRAEHWDGVPLGGARYVALAPRGAGLVLSITF